MNKKQDDGHTLRDHLQAVYKRTKKMPDDLVSPKLSNNVKYLLRLFADLSFGRQYGMTANPMSCMEIEAWMRITNRKLNDWEIMTLRAMDRGLINGN